MRMKSVYVRLFVPIVALVVVPLLGCDRSRTVSPSTSQATPEVASGVVTLVVKSDDGIKSLEIPDVADGATLESVLRSADGFDAVISGSGTTAFVNQIGDRATSGSEGWTFTVDGEWADKGIGSTTLHPPVTIQWKFGSMQTP